LSFIYYQLKQYDQSIAVNKKGIRLVPNFIDAYINIGQTYISMNMSDSATYFLTQAIQINPDNQTARQLLQSISK
jgi:tetratricopeptide (TPR) repeat protein